MTRRGKEKSGLSEWVGWTIAISLAIAGLLSYAYFRVF